MSQYVTFSHMSDLHSHIKANPGKTIAEWAECFGISRPYLYALVDGTRRPSLDVAKRIAAATDGSVPITAWPNFAKIADELRSNARGAA